MKNQDLIKALLEGAYISQRQNRRKGFSYALYKEKGVVIAAVSDVQFSIYKHEFKQKKGRFTLNLNIVRQQHGNWLTKQLYRELKKTKVK
jgi:hypothetical protein